MRWWLLWALLLLLGAGAAAQEPADSHLATPSPAEAAASPAPDPSPGQRPAVPSSGENPAQPVRRFDVRMNTQQKPNGLNESLLTLRVDTVHLQDNDWTVYTRIDIPSGIVAQTGNPTLGGLSDALTQVFVATPVARVQGLFGVRLSIPSATRENLGKGKWTVAPQVGVVVNLPEISDGTFMGVVAWNTSDFAGSGSRSHINQLTLKPLLHFELGDGWFIQTEPELQHNNLNGNWFIPLDLMVGKMVGEDQVVSVEYERSLSGYQPSFLQFLELRWGLFY